MDYTEMKKVGGIFRNEVAGGVLMYSDSISVFLDVWKNAAMKGVRQA